MPIAIDSTTTYAVPDAGLGSVSFAHTCAGSDRYILVGVCLGLGDRALTFSTGPAYNGVAMSSLQNSGDSPNTQVRVQVFGLVAPATGANNVTFGMSGSGDGRTVVMVRSFTGVHQTTPTGTPASAVIDSGNPTVDVSSAVDEMVADFMVMYDGSSSPAVGASQTNGSTLINENANGWGGTSIEPGAGTVTMSWTGGAGFDSATAAVPLKPTASSSLEQEGFRWFNDDGDEDASTGAAAQDTNITAPAGETRRLRMLLNATGDPATTQFKLQYRKVGETPWNDVL